MSVNATMAPRPSRIPSGTETQETGNVEPSRRTNQSRSLAAVASLARGRSSGHSAAGCGVPSGCRP